ncbi:Cys-tRNA(Pro) deacylase [bacterium]|nr:Cys-tRNA(Pro) deacylase [bacterium]
MKTNAVRLLDQAKVSYRLVEYEVDESDLSAESVARKIGLRDAEIFKTLALKGDKTGVLLVLVPAGTELDLKAIAQVSGNKRCEMLPLKDVQPVTGYIRGGVSPIGTKKRFPVYLDQSAMDQATISISAGVRGTQILLAPADLVKMVQATLAPVAKPAGSPSAELE